MIKIEIGKNDKGQRLDRFLKKYFDAAPLSMIYRLIRKDVKVNGKRGKEATLLEEGDVLTVYITEEQAAQEPRAYVVNTRSGVFHYPSCEGARSIHKKNRKDVTATRKELTDQGYVPCGYCEP